MIRRSLCVCVLGAFALISLQAEWDWELLGQRQVSDGRDHDRIAVTRARGTFKAIKIEVRRRGVDFHRVVIHFGNGDDQHVVLRSSIPAGGESRWIDVERGGRVIRSIDFWYDARSVGRGGSAVVRVLGRD